MNGHTTCPRARSDMTPCVIRHGENAYCDGPAGRRNNLCVGCEWTRADIAAERAAMAPVASVDGDGYDLAELQDALAWLDLYGSLGKSSGMLSDDHRHVSTYHGYAETRMLGESLADFIIRAKRAVGGK